MATETRERIQPAEVVALVASAGGTEALVAVLRALPGDFSAAVIVAQHLGRGSMLAQVLSTRVELPVRWATQGGLVEPGTVVVCPPRSVLEVLPDRTCVVRGIDQPTSARPIDVLLESLGASFGDSAVAVVTSATARSASSASTSRPRSAASGRRRGFRAR